MSPLGVPSPGIDRSFWIQEALAHDVGRPCPPLERSVAADVCIVGGGLAGLWAAYELLEREPALRVAILESDICGGGASGRNGGLFSSSWWDLRGLCGLYGEEAGLRYARAIADQVTEVERWCVAHGVDAWYQRNGLVVMEVNDEQVGRTREIAEYADALGVGSAVRLLSAEEARSFADSPECRGGAFIPDEATVQPARLARGLRRVALEQGAHIFERTRVTRLEPGAPAVVRTDTGGAVRAEHVVLAMGAWAAAWPRFRHRIGNIADYVVVTEPIPDRLEAIRWTGGAGIADGRELVYYLRTTDDGRVAIGGGASAVLFGGRIGRAASHHRRVAEVAARGLLRLFPQLEGVRFTHSWGGPIDMTASFTPFFQTLPPGNVHCGLGFSGHGLSATKLGGKTLASMVLGAEDEWTALPVVGDAVSRTPPEPLRWALVRLSEWGMEAADRAADAGRRPLPHHRILSWAPVAYRNRLRAQR